MSGDEGLKANTDRIRDLSDSLASIKQEFEDGANPMEGSDIDTVGSQDLLDVFDDFEGNWSIRRQELIDELDKLAGISDMAADAYSEIEQGLVEILEQGDAEEAAE